MSNRIWFTAFPDVSFENCLHQIQFHCVKPFELESITENDVVVEYYLISEKDSNNGKRSLYRDSILKGTDLSDLIEIFKDTNSRQLYPAHSDLFDAMSTDIVSKLANCIDGVCKKSGWTLLHFAVHHGFTELVRAVTNHLQKEDLLVKDANGFTALAWAAYTGNKEAVEIIIEKNPAALEILNNSGSNPLHDAAYSIKPEVVKLIVGKYPKLAYQKNRDRKTPLIDALTCWYTNNFEDRKKVVEYLMEISDDKELSEALEFKPSKPTEDTVCLWENVEKKLSTFGTKDDKRKQHH